MSRTGPAPNPTPSQIATSSRRRLLLWCLLAVTAGTWLVGRILHRQLVFREVMAYESSLAAYDPVRISSLRTVHEVVGLPARTTFGQFLVSQGFASSAADKLVSDVRAVYNLAHVRAGNEVRFLRSGRGDLRTLTYQIDPDRILKISNEGNDYHADIIKVPYTIATQGVSGIIQDSLIRAVENTGEQDQLALSFADIFGWDIDFNTDTQPGDTFEILVEKRSLEGKFSSYGRILAAEYRHGSHAFQAVLYHDPEGRPAYYAPSGKSLKKAFLRSPLRFAAHITSGFSYHRYHPILKFSRPHLGIDYGAPVGSAVQAVADGRVELAGWHGEGGKEIKLRHAMGYETYYLHLSQILVRPGEIVQQGELIARSGQTGLATGPHLDFRITQHGRFRNFLALNLPPAESVAARDMDDFASVKAKVLDQLASLRPAASSGGQSAALDSPHPSTGK